MVNAWNSLNVKIVLLLETFEMELIYLDISALLNPCFTAFNWAISLPPVRSAAMGGDTNIESVNYFLEFLDTEIEALRRFLDPELFEIVCL